MLNFQRGEKSVLVQCNIVRENMSENIANVCHLCGRSLGNTVQQVSPVQVIVLSL